MTTEPDARLTEALQQTQQYVSAIEDHTYRTSTETFTATDETGTVRAVVNGDRWLTGLQIEDGLLRLGVETVQQRIGEAVRNAQRAGLESLGDSQQQLQETLSGFGAVIQGMLGDLPR
jgi:DNA-binding protein YbaB